MDQQLGNHCGAEEIFVFNAYDQILKVLEISLTYNFFHSCISYSNLSDCTQTKK